MSSTTANENVEKDDLSKSGKDTESQHTAHHIPCEVSTATSEGDLWLFKDEAEESFEYRDTYDVKKSSRWLEPEIIRAISYCIDNLSPMLRELSLKIHDHPELAWEEHYAHDTLTEFMASQGFDVQRHYLGIDTAWRAEFRHTSSSPSGQNQSRRTRTLGVNSEMDALPGIGHACGHNLIAIAGVAVALAAKHVLIRQNLSGNIVLLGTPAEEGGSGKVKLIEAGGYKDMDVCLMCHPGPGPKNSSGTGPSLSLTRIEVEYFGHTAHASAAPWEGQNALDAAFIAYSAIAVLRQQIKPDHRVHGIIQGKDWAANIIPDYAKLLWYARAPSAAEVDVLVKRVVNCFKAAALATGCRVEIKLTETMYDIRQNSELIQEYSNIIQDQFEMSLNGVQGAIGGSTDFGNVTYELPAIHPSFAIPTQPNGGNHTPGFTAAARTKQAHACTLRVAKALTQVGLRAILDDEYLEKVKAAFNPNK